MAGLNFSDRVNENASKLNSLEEMLGEGLRQPFSNTNAGVNVAQLIW